MANEGRKPQPYPRNLPAESYVWRLPNEAPGTLAEIFAAEDSRRANLLLYELQKANAFRRCSEAIGVAVDPYELILAMMNCIGCHLNPLDRPADYRSRMRILARCARAAAAALDELSSSLNRTRLGWSVRFKLSGLPDPTNPEIIKDLYSLAAGLESMLAGGAFKDRGGAPKMWAFEVLIRALARIFENVTGRRAAITRDEYRGPGYGGKFWDLVEIVRPVVAAIIETSGAGPFRQPLTEGARGKFIEQALKRFRTEKTRAASH
jgi:hypothetical protein